MYSLVVALLLTGTGCRASAPTKLCLNKECNEVAFTTSTTRQFPSQDERFLPVGAGETVKIVAFKYSKMDTFLAMVRRWFFISRLGF